MTFHIYLLAGRYGDLVVHTDALLCVETDPDDVDRFLNGREGAFRVERVATTEPVSLRLEALLNG